MSVRSGYTRRVLVPVVLASTLWCDPAVAAGGLRWTGDARVAADADGAGLGGPALRFRYGFEFIDRPKRDPNDEDPDDDDGWVDIFVGSWMGFELSSGLLVGRNEVGELGIVTAVGFRPWLSQRQRRWFLRTERISVLGALLPETGAVFGLEEGPRWYLGWELPIGGEWLQIVPGVLWISPGAPLHLFGTLALRVPM